MKDKLMKSTLLLPTLNEIEAMQVIMPQINKNWIDEIIVIDGGSTDGTVEFCKENGYKVFSQSNRGYGKGMLEGMKHAAGEIIVEFPPDGNSLPHVIPDIIEKINEGYDLVIASRYKNDAKSDDDDFLTALGNRMFTSIVNIMFKSNYTDVLVGFRAFRKSVAEKLSLDAPGLDWTVQSSIQFAKANYRVTEIPADEPERIGGERKMMPFKTGWQISKIILYEFIKKRG